MVCVHQDFVAELVREYGAAAVSGWRFRIGTEENAWDGKVGIAHLCWHNVRHDAAHTRIVGILLLLTSQGRFHGSS